MKFYLGLTLALCAVSAGAQPLPVQSQEGRDTPQQEIETSVHDFAKAINEGSFDGAQSGVEVSREGYFGAQVWLRDYAKVKDFDIEIWSVEPLPLQLDKEKARVAVTYRLNPVDFTAPVMCREILDLKRSSSRLFNPKTKIKSFIWQIVPPVARPAEPPKEAIENGKWLAYFSWKIAQKPLAPADYAPAQSLQNLKDLSLATLQFSQNEGSIAVAPEYIEEALESYVKNDSVFSVPNSYERYAFNANLAGRSIGIGDGITRPLFANLVAQPEKVILFYEGRDEKLNFRYDGRAAVSFADGHVALVSPDEAKDVRWLP